MNITLFAVLCWVAAQFCTTDRVLFGIAPERLFVVCVCHVLAVAHKTALLCLVWKNIWGQVLTWFKTGVVS